MRYDNSIHNILYLEKTLQRVDWLMEEDLDGGSKRRQYHNCEWKSERKVLQRVSLSNVTLPKI